MRPIRGAPPPASSPACSPLASGGTSEPDSACDRAVGGRRARLSVVAVGVDPRRSFRLSLMVVGVVALLSGLLAGCGSFGASTPTNPVVEAQIAAISRAIKIVGVRLPRREGAPAPVLGEDGFARPLAPHVVFGFLPYWELGSAGRLSLADLTTVAYYAVQPTGTGGLLSTGPGWSDLSSPLAASVLARAAAAGDRTLLTVATADQSVLNDLCADPIRRGRSLAAAVLPLLEAHHFAGVDLDLEGQGDRDRAGFVHFVAGFSAALHSLDPGASVVLDTYPTSAADAQGFFAIGRLSHLVSSIFIMGYDMADQSSPSANAPLGGSAVSDVAALQDYVAVAPARKLILGVPFYGYNYPADAGTNLADTDGPPVALTFNQIAAAGHKVRWDPDTDTPWTAYKVRGHWYETWFDDPVSIALKTALASVFKLAGVGVWYLGAGSDEPAMREALLGGAPPLKLRSAG